MYHTSIKSPMKMSRLLIVILLVLASIGLAEGYHSPRRTTHRRTHRAVRCGMERWPVKIGTDVDFPLVNFTPIDVSIKTLEELPKPRGARLPYKRRVNETEKSTYRVEGTIARVKVEIDSDLHILLVSGSNRLVAEIPSPACAIHAPLMIRFVEARKTALSLKPNQRVRITGIGFFDRIHGQGGGAKNGFELHPVYMVELLK